MGRRVGEWPTLSSKTVFANTTALFQELKSIGRSQNVLHFYQTLLYVLIVIIIGVTTNEPDAS